MAKYKPEDVLNKPFLLQALNLRTGEELDKVYTEDLDSREKKYIQALKRLEQGKEKNPRYIPASKLPVEDVRFENFFRLKKGTDDPIVSLAMELAEVKEELKENRRWFREILTAIVDIKDQQEVNKFKNSSLEFDPYS